MPRPPSKKSTPWALARLGLAREVTLPPAKSRTLAALIKEGVARGLARALAWVGLSGLAVRLFGPRLFDHARPGGGASPGGGAPGRRVLVEAPPVRVALELYAAAKGALDGDESDRRIISDLLAGWLPAPLFEHLASLPIEEQITTAIDLADEGLLTDADRLAASAKALADGEAEEHDPFERASRIEWDVLLALYAGAYGGSPWEVYTRTPWTLFLHLVARLDQVTALRHMMDLDLVLMPHLGDKADEALAEMRSRGGEPFGPKPKQSLGEQRAAVEELRSLMGR